MFLFLKKKNHTEFQELSYSGFFREQSLRQWLTVLMHYLQGYTLSSEGTGTAKWSEKGSEPYNDAFLDWPSSHNEPRRDTKVTYQVLFLAHRTFPYRLGGKTIFWINLLVIGRWEINLLGCLQTPVSHWSKFILRRFNSFITCPVRRHLGCQKP